MVGLLLFIALVLGVVFSIVTNRDIFSPTKFYFLSIFLFFSDIFFSTYNYGIYVCYIIFIVIGLNIALFEKVMTKREYWGNEKIQYSISSRKLKRITIILWLISLFPIMAQIWLINYFGGIDGYINILNLRVLMFRGLGTVTILIQTIAIINVFYFGIGLVGKMKKPSWWLFYIFHLTIVIVIGLLSGSRGSLLGNFVTMAVLYHYIKRPLSIKLTALLALSLLFIALVIGVARHGYKVVEGKLETGLTDPRQLLEHRLEIRSGLIPLEFVYSAPPENLQYGLTFLSAVTNFVPRKLWPGKPDSGGVVLTKTYLGDETSRTTNYSGGIVVESIINFGLLGGTLLGFSMLFSLMVSVVYIYSRIIFKLKKGILPLVMAQLFLYILFMRCITGLPIVEFTNSFVGLATKMIPLWLIYVICFRLKILPRFA